MKAHSTFGRAMSLAEYCAAMLKRSAKSTTTALMITGSDEELCASTLAQLIEQGTVLDATVIETQVCWKCRMGGALFDGLCATCRPQHGQ